MKRSNGFLFYNITKTKEMNKLWLIIKREYLTRVKKRSFILATLLTPLALHAPPLPQAYFKLDN